MQELQRITDCLYTRGEKNVFYIVAAGGVGKTRILQEIDKRVTAAGEGFYSSGIIDLYHTDTHSTSEVERAIVHALDPLGNEFKKYRNQRRLYELARDRGSDPSTLEKQRALLSALFVEEFRQMALDAKKLVLLFDTLELLQFESSVVEEQAGLRMVDTLLRSWILDKLPKLGNVLIVFAGRPKEHSAGETVDHQQRLERDMHRAFGDQMQIIHLDALTLAETGQLIKDLSKDEEIIPEPILPIIHKLTGGSPILVHLLFDVIRMVAPEPTSYVNELSEKYAGLLDKDESDPAVDRARKQVETDVLSRIFNNAGRFGGYLGSIAMLPKGINPEILVIATGLTNAEAQELIAGLRQLSFTKYFYTPEGLPRLDADRLFFHDEMYRLLTQPGVISNVREQQRRAALALINNYYDPKLQELDQQIKANRNEIRVALREKWQKLQVERLYYMLVRDPKEGYLEYKRLTAEANAHRWVGFAMRLLDEFLRYYNPTERRMLFEKRNVTHEQVVRDSAQMWVERFHWWGQMENAINFAGKVLEDPQNFHIDPNNDFGTLGNITALFTRAHAMLYGYDEGAVARSLEMLACMPQLDVCTPNETLARARLGTSIGYEYRWGGKLQEAVSYYSESIAAFHKLGTHLDEMIMVQNNQMYVYGKQGQVPVARILGMKSLDINKEFGSEYSKGLTLTNLASVERLGGMNYNRALDFAEQACEIFQELVDHHGLVRAYLNIGSATRLIADNEMIGASMDMVREKMEKALDYLQKGMAEAQAGQLKAEEPGLLAEMGKVYRSLGRLTRQAGDHQKSLQYFRKAEDCFEEALQSNRWSITEQADVIEDMAEVLFSFGDFAAAENKLQEVERMIGERAIIRPGETVQPEDVPNWFFQPLGKLERLRGGMAFDSGNAGEGMQHFVVAYAYFTLFSPESVEKERMLMPLFTNHLRSFGFDEQRDLFLQTKEWARKSDYMFGGVDVRPFIKTLGNMLGMPR
jgi:tetratricopeptide (TPR) repeat protein